MPGIESRTVVLAQPVEAGGVEGARSEPRRVVLSSSILIAALITCAVCSVLLSRTKAPWVDEGSFAAPARALYQTGSMATYNVDPTGSWLNGDLIGIHEHTYTNMPLHTITLAAIFSIAGFSLQAARSVSIVSALIVITAWFFIIKILCRSEMIAALAAGLMAFDSTLLWQAADARCDMMCLAFGSAGIAIYLGLRDKNLALSLLAGSTLAAASAFTHPNGLLMAAELLFIVVWFDRRALRWQHAASVIPWLAALALWGLYIQHAPTAFVAQFQANANARGGTRFTAILSPFRAVFNEIWYRYLNHFSTASPAGPRPSTLNIFLAAICLALIPMAAVSAEIRNDRGYKAILGLASIAFLYFTFIGLKLEFYIVYMIPLFASLAALLLWLNFRWRPVFCVWTLGFAALLHINTVITNITDDSYHKQHLPMIRALAGRARPNDLIMGSVALCFDFPFQRIDDDTRLGYFSRFQPAYIVVDRFYKRFFDLFSKEQPEVGRYILRVLQDRSQVVFQNDYYTVYMVKGVS